MEVSGRKVEEDDDVARLESFCEPCQDEHVNTRADGVCQECKEYMCNRCFRHHLKARQCRNHVLIDSKAASVLLRETNENTQKCKHHENETIKYYCRKHDIVGCGDCMVRGHGACKPGFITDLSKDFQENEEFKSLVRKLEQLTFANTEIRTAIQDNKKELEIMHKTALNEICKFRTDINQFLDKAEDAVKTEINRLKSDNEYVLTKLVNECKQLSSNTEKVRNKFNTEIYKGSSLFIKTMEGKPEIANMQRALDRMQSESRMKSFKFIPDKQLQSIIASGGNLGQIDVGVSAGIRRISQDSRENMTEQASGGIQMGKNAPRSYSGLCIGASERNRLSDCSAFKIVLPTKPVAPRRPSAGYAKEPIAEQLKPTNLTPEEMLKANIKKIMELTCCSQDEAELALYDNHNNVGKAIKVVISDQVYESEEEWMEAKTP